MIFKTKEKIAVGTVHPLPDDWAAAIRSDATFALWQDITPLARNEWICWITSGKKTETRTKRIKVGLSKMRAGERRPCCWIGCIHRTDKEMNRSQKFVLKK